MKVSNWGFYLALFLIRLPPFYFFPVIRSSILTTHSLARLIALLLLIQLIYCKSYKKISKVQWKLFGLYLLVLLVHSISALKAVNGQMFLLRYKDIVFPGIFLLVSFVNVRKLMDVAKVLIGGLVVNFFYQMLMFLVPSFYKTFARIFVYDGHAEFVGFNLSRGRIFIETYDEMVLPIVYGYGEAWGRVRSKWVARVGFVMVVVPTLLSNFRSRLLMLIVGLLGMATSWVKNMKAVVVTMLAIITFSVVVDNLLLKTMGFSMVDRVLLRDKHEDIQSLESRWEGISNSFYLAGEYFPLGIGMGNYYDNLPTNVRSTLFSLVGHYGEVWTSSLNPHNIFAQIVVETGYLGLGVYVYVLAMFMRDDIRHFKSKQKNGFPVFALAFWILFSYALFNPATTLTYISLFWLMRSFALNESTS